MALKPTSPKPGGGGQNRPGGGSGPSRPGGGSSGPSRPGGGPGTYRPAGGPGSGPSRPGGGGGRRPFQPRIVQAEHRINEHIKVPELRLVGDNLEEVSTAAGEKVEPGIYATAKLQGWAETMELDLVEISPNADPPVARIVDYNKFLYQKRKKEKEMKANAVKQQLKEIRFGPETGEHDFEFKLRHAKNFLGDGNKVKAYVQFRGRAIMFKDRGELLLLRFLKELEEFGTPEQLPRMDGKRMMVIITPKKSGGKK